LTAEEKTLEITQGRIVMSHASHIHHVAVSISSPTLPFSIGESP
jgi:hypothetical protein